jgi:tRNA(fMet)-specific endonuclease VapC
VRYLLDTNAFSDLMRAQSRVTARFTGVGSPDSILISTIVRGEVLHGLEQMSPGQRRTELTRNADKLFAIIPCEALPAAVADVYAQIKRQRQRIGLPLDDNDCWIAASAVHHGAVLVTRDSDFARVTGLTVEDWTV